MEKFDVIIIGAGPAGLEAAHRLAESGWKILLLEKESAVGGKLQQWDKLFPDFSSSKDLLQQLAGFTGNNHIQLKTNSACKSIEPIDALTWEVTDTNELKYRASSVLLSTGFEVFDARRKEEYGYGIYPNVITSVQLEEMLAEQKLQFHSAGYGDRPRIAFIQCVGSRDEKTGNHYCSRNCCICAVKQAIEVKELLPSSDIYCFYMDLRMFGEGYEELYRKAQQEFNINFIRGRVSEVSPALDQQVVLKAEDTLLSRPVKATFDMVVLMVGMEPSPGTKQLSRELGIDDDYGYYKSTDNLLSDNQTIHHGLFLAGTGKRQYSIPDVLKDASAAAYSINEYLLQNR